jgi:ligand-binding sensor domain-containing protein/predicted nuclease with TOPRIM domain
MRKHVIVVFILATLTIHCFTNDIADQIVFDHLSVENGLSQNNALVTFQDSKGFIWIGTEDGLNFYDGYECKIYRNNDKDPHSLSNNFVRSVVEDKKGNLWIGTQSGLNLYNWDTDNFTRYMHDANDPGSIVTDGIQWLFIDSKNRLWILTEQGIDIMDLNSHTMQVMVTEPSNPNSLPTNLCRFIIEDKNDQFWIATYGGLVNFNEKKNIFTIYKYEESNPNSISSNRVQRIFIDSKDRLWVGTFDNGLDMMINGQGRFTRYPADPTKSTSLPNSLVNWITEDENKHIWIATSGGLSLYNELSDNFTSLYKEAENNESLSSSDITHIFFDRNYRMWISARFGGLNIYDKGKKKFIHYKSQKSNPKSLLGDNVTSFAEDDYGNIWVGVDGGGLNYLDRSTNEFSHIVFDPEKPEGLTNNKVLALLLADDGKLWIGMWGGGVNVYDPNTGEFKHYLNNPDDETSLSGNNIFYLFEDSQNIVWVATWGNGINRYNRENDDFTRFTNNPNDPASITGSGCVMMIEDHLGYLWIAHEGAGISILDRKTGKFTHYTHSDQPGSLTNDAVYSLYEDTKHRMWVGTNGGGFCLFDREKGTFTAYRMTDGLPNDVINGILEDKEGNLWLSTNDGLCKFNTDSIIYKNYNSSDGLQSNQFTRWAFKKLSTGEFLFGGVNGFNLFDPENVRDNPYKPPVYITGFKLFNENVPIGKESVLKKGILVTKQIVLKYRQNVFSFEYTALNYRQSEKNQYKYLMEGFNDDWIDAKNERKVTFTNLDPGKYIFRVIASNNDGVWNNTGTSIKVRIVPPIWRTWWFLSLLIMSVVYLVYYFIKQREKTLKHDKAILEENLREGKAEVEKQKNEITQQRVVLQEKEKAEEIQKWYNAGLAKFSDLVSKNKDELKTLSRMLISELVDYTGANIGGMYIISDDENTNEQYLEMIGYHAPDMKKAKETRIMIGEGYIGTCYKERELRIIDNLPEGYAKLSSGLGESHLKYLAILPIRLDELVLGVFEILSLKKLDVYKIEFIEKVGEMIAATLMTTRANDKMRVMYEQIKQKTEEMSAQEEELRQNLEEMSATQEEMGRREKDIEKIKKEFADREKILKQEISDLKKELDKIKKA